MSGDVIFIERENSLIARIGKDIDHHTAAPIREAIDSRVFYVRPEQLVLDFGSVGFMDSSGLALIIGRCEVASAVGASVRLLGLDKQLLKLVRLAGIERIPNLSVAACED